MQKGCPGTALTRVQQSLPFVTETELLFRNYIQAAFIKTPFVRFHPIQPVSPLFFSSASRAMENRLSSARPNFIRHLLCPVSCCPAAVPDTNILLCLPIFGAKNNDRTSSLSRRFPMCHESRIFLPISSLKSLSPRNTDKEGGE